MDDKQQPRRASSLPSAYHSMSSSPAPMNGSGHSHHPSPPVKVAIRDTAAALSSSAACSPSDSVSGLSWRVRCSYGVGHVLNDLVASCWFSYLLVFLRTVLLFRSTQAGLLLLIGQISDGLATPVVGLLSDRTQSRFGKRRLWILLGSIVVVLSFPPIFHSPLLLPWSSPSALSVVYYAVVIVVFQWAWASVQVSHLALVPELTRDNGERVFLNSLRSVFTILSNLAVFLLAFFILDSSAPSSASLGPADLPSFFRLALLVVCIGSVFSLVFIAGVPEPEPRPKKVGQRRVEWWMWFSRLSFYQTAAIYTCTRLMVNVSQTYIPLFLLVTLHAAKSSIASVPLTVFGAGLLSTCVCEMLTRRLGSEVLTFCGCCTVLVSCVGVWLIPAGHGGFAYAIAFMLGSGTGIVGVSALSLICELVGDCCESGAFVYGAMSFSDKIANGVAIMIAEALTPAAACSESAAQHEPCMVVTAEQEMYYRWVMIIAPGGSAVVAMLVLGFIILTKRHRMALAEPEPSLPSSPSQAAAFAHRRSSSSSSSSSSRSLSSSALSSPCGPCTPNWDYTVASAMQGVRGVTMDSPVHSAADREKDRQRREEEEEKEEERREAGLSSESTPLLSRSYNGSTTMTD